MINRWVRAMLVLLASVGLLGIAPALSAEAGGVRLLRAEVTYDELADDKDLADFLAVVAEDVDALWSAALAGDEYESPARFVVVEEDIETGCGPVEPGFGNAYFCPPDNSIYVDPVLMEQLAQAFGPVAAAVVIAHEWGHHVQDQLGIEAGSITSSLTVQTNLQTELQADCLAGVWAANAEENGRLEPGDLDRAVSMIATVLGDGDRLPNGVHDDPVYLDEQHGDSALRAWWFLQGFGGGIEPCGIVEP